jgi:MFS family permease
MSVAERPNLLRSSLEFRRLWLARTISNLGDGVAFVALVLLVQEKQEKGVAVGTLLLVQAVPRFLGPLAGAVADRTEQRALMIGCDLGNALIFGLIALLAPSFPVLLVLAGASSCLDTLFAPAGRSAMPAIVGREDLLQANAWLGTSFNLQLALGPMLGGVLVLLLGTSGALTANMFSFLASATILAGLPALRSAGEAGGPGSRFFVTGTREGLRYAWGNPAVRALVIALFLGVAFAAMDNTALVFLVRNSLHGSPLAYGFMAASFGVGMIAASGGLSLRLIRVSAGAIFLFGWLFNGLGTLLTGLAPVLLLAGAGQLLAGFGNGAENVAAETLIQRIVPRPMLGRTFGLVSTAAFGGSTVAYAFSGFLVDVTSPRTVFLIGGSGVLVVTLALVVFLRRALMDELERA